MERYNPFDDSDIAGATSSALGTPLADTMKTSLGSNRYTSLASSKDGQNFPTKSQLTSVKNSRYTTSFPDPFREFEQDESTTLAKTIPSATAVSTPTSARSNSVTFSMASHSVDDSPSSGSPIRSGRQTGGISSFLTRATSVTSSTVTDRMSEAVGSMKSAVDSLSNQIQQVVPTNLNERLSGVSATNLISNNPLNEQQQSTASYLASKLSSATNQFTSSAQSSNSLPTISRQRVILILDSPNNTNWPQQFASYRKLTSGSGSTSAQSAFTSFFSSATAQLTATSQVLTAGASGSLGSYLSEGSDLVEQVDFRDVTVLANQSTSTATLMITNNSGNNRQGTMKASTRIIRPEYVVVKQRSKSNHDHMRSVVTALNYSLVPIFEPIEVWNIFQDRLLVFSKLLRVQKVLGKEKFPLIPQIYCQTHQDLLNYINSSASISLPCLVRTGSTGSGKIRADSIQVLKALASIVSTSNVCCTLEPFLSVKYDYLVQKMGTNLKLLKRSMLPSTESGSAESARGYFNSVMADTRQDSQYSTKQPASRQTSIGSSVLSSLMSATNQQPLTRRSSNPISPAYERSMSEVSSKHRGWIDAISKEFNHKLQVFCIKIIVTTNDREYVVGLSDCAMDFVGSQENQDEDRRSFIELVMSHMNTNLSKINSGEGSLNSTINNAEKIRRCSSDDNTHSLGGISSLAQQQDFAETSLKDKKKFNSQSQINGIGETISRVSFGQMSNRSQSVSVNQSDFSLDEQAMNKPFSGRRVSDDGPEDLDDPTSSGQRARQIGDSSGLHQRQSSLGQSFFDQTSTAFSSLHKQSMSILKRFDSRAYDSTPPHSAKSDQAFERISLSDDQRSAQSMAAKKNGFKSQSIDSSALDNPGMSKNMRPAKPPPPKSMVGVMSSNLSQRNSSEMKPTTSSFAMQSQQNSSLSNLNNGNSTEGDKPRTKVVRQNSALSAFEPFDPEISVEYSDGSRKKTSIERTVASSTGSLNVKPSKPLDPATKKNINFDSASITSGDSNSTNETTTAEDTMNNLKKTFASIFGDKCE